MLISTLLDLLIPYGLLLVLILEAFMHQFIVSVFFTL